MKENLQTMMFVLMIAFAGILLGCGGNKQDSGNAATAVSEKPKIGDRVIFKLASSEYSEGKLDSIEGEKYKISTEIRNYEGDAKDVYSLPKSGAKPDVKVGDYVVTNWAKDTWAGGKIVSVSDGEITVNIANRSADKKSTPDKVIKVDAEAVATIKKDSDEKEFEVTGQGKKPIIPTDWKPKAGEKIIYQRPDPPKEWEGAIFKSENAGEVSYSLIGVDGLIVNKVVIAPMPTAKDALPKTDNYVIVKPEKETYLWRFAMVTAISGTDIDVKFKDGKTAKLKAGEFLVLN